MHKDDHATLIPDRNRMSRTVLWIAVVAAVYFLSARFSLLLQFKPQGIAAIWPPSGIFLSAVLLTRRAARPYLIGVLFLADCAAEVLSGSPLTVGLAYAAVLSFEAALSAWLLLRFSGGPPSFGTIREVLGFIFLSVLLSDSISAVLAAAAAKWSLGVSFKSSWFWWWSSDGVGSLLVTPLIMSWAHSAKKARGKIKSRAFEFGAMIFLMTFMNAVVFSRFAGTPRLILLFGYCNLSFLIWASLRFGMAGTAMTSLILAALIIWNTVRGHLPFLSGVNVPETAVMIQIAITMAAIPSMLLAALFSERRRGREELSESEERFRAIASNTPDHILVQDRDLRYLLVVNPQLGLTEADMIGRTDRDFLKEEDVEKLGAIKRRVLETGESIHLETSLQNSKGKHEFFEGVYVPRFDSAGRTAGLFGYFRNVTERKRAEKGLAESEEKFRVIFDNASDGMFLVDPETLGYHLCNRICVNMLGYSKDEFVNLKIADLHPEEELPFVAEQIDKFRRGGKGIIRDTRFKRKDGSVFTADVSPALMSIGGKKYLLIMFKDITERIRAEDALQESERKYRTLVDRSPDGIFIIDLKGSFISVNKAMCENLHYSEEELLNMRIMDIVPAEYLQLHRIRLERILKEGGIRESGEYLVRGKDGKEHYIEVRSVPYLKENRVIGVQGIAHDITDRKKAEEALLQSEQRNKTLLESVNDYTYSVEIQNGRPVKTVHGLGCEKVAGFSPGDYSADPDLWIQMVHFEDRKMVEHYADPLLEGRSVPALEHRIIHKNGSVVWIRNTYVPKRDAGGKVTGYDGLIIDITARKLAEIELRKSEAAQRNFSERLTRVLEATNNLPKAKSFDELCRNAVVFAKQLMNFDRTGIWLFLPDRRTMRGSFGMDENGNLRDERGMRLPIVERHIRELIPSKKQIVLFEDEDLRNHKGAIVGKGSHVVAGLWNGDEIIGLLGADNLIRKQPIEESDIKLLNLFSVSLGHLFTLKRAEEQIRKDLEEKNIMLKEIHHRVRNNLNVITSLLNLQSDRINTRDEALAAFEESKNRIYAMALVHSSLYKEGDFSSIDLSSFVQSLTQNLLQVYKKDVQTDLRIEDFSLDLNTAVPCGLILNELVTNALKHAFKGKSGGLVTIGFRMLKDNTCQLTVRDNGIGLPKEIDVGAAKSLGLVIVNQLVDQIDGRLEVTRKEGTMFQIKFPAGK
jgi:PAS domain S-box-containing protein